MPRIARREGERNYPVVFKCLMRYRRDMPMIAGPTFPHEVAGFSGGNKYLFPGIAGEEIIPIVQWLFFLCESRENRTFPGIHTQSAVPSMYTIH